jgi:hypothetical protein
MVFKSVPRDAHGVGMVNDTDVYHEMLKPERSTTSSWSLSLMHPMSYNTRELLVHEVVREMGPSALNVAPFGEYIKSQWMGEENAVAVDYLLKGMKVFRARDEASLDKAGKAGEVLNFTSLRCRRDSH